MSKKWVNLKILHKLSRHSCRLIPLVLTSWIELTLSLLLFAYYFTKTRPLCGRLKNPARVSCAHLLKSQSTAARSSFCKLVYDFAMETRLSIDANQMKIIEWIKSADFYLGQSAQFHSLPMVDWYMAEFYCNPKSAFAVYWGALSSLLQLTS